MSQMAAYLPYIYMTVSHNTEPFPPTNSDQHQSKSSTPSSKDNQIRTMPSWRNQPPVGSHNNYRYRDDRGIDSHRVPSGRRETSDRVNTGSSAKYRGHGSSGGHAYPAAAYPSYDKRESYEKREGHKEREGHERRHGYEKRHGYERRHGHEKRHGREKGDGQAKSTAYQFGEYLGDKHGSKFLGKRYGPDYGGEFLGKAADEAFKMGKEFFNRWRDRSSGAPDNSGSSHHSRRC